MNTTQFIQLAKKLATTYTEFKTNVLDSQPHTDEEIEMLEDKFFEPYTNILNDRFPGNYDAFACLVTLSNELPEFGEGYFADFTVEELVTEEAYF